MITPYCPASHLLTTLPHSLPISQLCRRTMTESSKQPAAAYVAAPRSLHYEFGGPAGALGVTLAVPFFTYCTTSPRL